MYSIDSHIETLNQNHKDLIAKSEKQTSEYIELLTKAKDIIPKVEKAFNDVGFTFEVISCRKNGLSEDGDQLHVSLKILPKSPTYKYVRFEGYDKRGAGKNHSKLLKKASDLQDKIFKLTGVKCQVNYYSFEITNRKPVGGSILVEFWIK